MSHTKEEFVTWGNAQLAKINSMKDFKQRVEQFGVVAVLNDTRAEMNECGEFYTAQMEVLKANFLSAIDIEIAVLQSAFDNATISE